MEPTNDNNSMNANSMAPKSNNQNKRPGSAFFEAATKGNNVERDTQGNQITVSRAPYDSQAKGHLVRAVPVDAKTKATMNGQESEFARDSISKADILLATSALAKSVASMVENQQAKQAVSNTAPTAA